jgi:Ca2+-binding RTX toxin-like protein
VIGGAGNDNLSGGDGNDNLISGEGNDYLSGGRGDDILIGGAGNDKLIGGVGDDQLFAGDGDDYVFLYGTGNQLLDGGADRDVLSVYFAKANSPLLMSYVSATNTFTLNLGGSISTVVNVEELLVSGTAQDDVIVAGSGNDFLDGGAGNDYLAGGAGDDFLYGIQGSDALFGEAGNDTVLGGEGSDYLSGGAGDDLIYGQEGNDELSGGAGNDSLIGGVENDILLGGAGDDVYYIERIGSILIEQANQGVDTVRSCVDYILGTNSERLGLLDGSDINGTGNAFNNFIAGNSGNNLLKGEAGNDTLQGNLGNDTLDGGLETDLMIGSRGNNVYIVNSASDVIKEGSTVASEIDTVRSSVSYRLSANLEQLFLENAAHINAIGTNQHNLLVGNAGNNLLNGQAGNDTLIGNGGNDILVGSTGNDVLTGGSGNDSFNYFTGADFASSAIAIDQITDFGRVTGNRDTILLSRTTFNVGTSFANVTTDKLAATSAARIVFSTGTGNLFYNQNASAAGFGSGGQFAHLNGIAAMVASDFTVVA